MLKLVSLLLATALLGGCSDAGAPTDTAIAPAGAATVDAAATAEDERPEISDRRIVVVADPWCPHNCKAGAAKEGYMIAIAREALAEAGYTLDYRNFSWARALKMTRQGEFNAVVGAFRTDAPDFVFPENAQGRASIALFTHPDNDWTYQGIPSLENQTLLAINGYSYTRELDEYIARNQNNRDRIWILSGGAPLERALRLLATNRTDVFAEDDYVVAWAVRNNPDILRPRRAGQVNETRSYVAFSPALENSEELARVLSDGTRKLVERGRVREILAGYGIEGVF